MQSIPPLPIKLITMANHTRSHTLYIIARLLWNFDRWKGRIMLCFRVLWSLSHLGFLDFVQDLPIELCSDLRSPISMIDFVMATIAQCHI